MLETKISLNLVENVGCFADHSMFPLGLEHHFCISLEGETLSKRQGPEITLQSGCADCSQRSGISREVGRFFQHIKPVTCCNLGMKWHDLSISRERSAGWTKDPDCTKPSSTDLHAQSSPGASPCQGKVNLGSWDDETLASICIIYQGLWPATSGIRKFTNSALSSVLLLQHGCFYPSVVVWWELTVPGVSWAQALC